MQSMAVSAASTVGAASASVAGAAAVGATATAAAATVSTTATVVSIGQKKDVDLFGPSIISSLMTHFVENFLSYFICMTVLSRLQQLLL